MVLKLLEEMLIPFGDKDSVSAPVACSGKSFKEPKRVSSHATNERRIDIDTINAYPKRMFRVIGSRGRN
jgi:hypothetical protein